MCGYILSGITLCKHENRLQFEGHVSIFVYSRILYFESVASEPHILEAEGEKHRIEFTDLLEQKLVGVSYQKPNFLVLRFESKSLIKIPVDDSPYESFLINGPCGELFVFRQSEGAVFPGVRSQR